MKLGHGYFYISEKCSMYIASVKVNKVNPLYKCPIATLSAFLFKFLYVVE